MNNDIRILALDMATRTGWATNLPVPCSGVQDFSLKRGESPGMRFLRFHRWLEHIYELTDPQVVAFEQAHHRGGAATSVALGLQAHLLSWCAEHDIEHVPCHTATLKKFATGKGNANKEAIKKAYVRKWGKEPIDDNEADAKWLLEWAINEFSLNHKEKETLE